MRHAENLVRCTRILVALNAEHGWDLTADQLHAYAVAIATWAAADDATLCRQAEYYHADHQLVRALRHAGDPAHHAAWMSWSSQAARIAWQQLGGDDPITGADDLAQLALDELAGALPEYHYASRFSTWAYTVIVRRIRRALRDAHAAKRSVQTTSLDTVVAAGSLVEPSSVEEPVHANLLYELVMHILTQAPDQRMAAAFQLWASDDRRLVEIGQQLHLSAGRVSILLERARQLLQQHPAIQEWLDTPEHDRAIGEKTIPHSVTNRV